MLIGNCILIRIPNTILKSHVNTSFKAKKVKMLCVVFLGLVRNFIWKSLFYLLARQELQLISAVVTLCIQTKPKKKKKDGGEKEKNIFPKNFVISNAMQPGTTHLTISKGMVSYKCNREQSAILFHDLARKNKFYSVTWGNLTSLHPWSLYTLQFCPSKDIIKERSGGPSERTLYPFQLHLIYELLKLFPEVCLHNV